MRSVEKEWYDLTARNKAEGKSVRFYGPDGTPKFEGRIQGYGWGTRYPGDRVFKWARFYDCRTLNKDLSTRKGSAKEREQSIPYDWQFIFLGEDKEISIPKTASELTDEHIGMEFTFHGNPRVSGVFQGFKQRKGTEPGREKIGIKAENTLWGLDFAGYFISHDAKLTYLGTPKNPSGDGVDTDAKLAAYLNQELAKTPGFTGVGIVWLKNQHVGEEIVRIIKEITQPTP